MDRDLYNAARSGDVSFLKTKEDTEIRNLLSQQTPKGNSVLHIAAESNQLEFFQEAARLMCSPPVSLFKQANSKGDTPLHSAVRAGSTEVVGFIIQHAKQLFSDIEQGHDHVEEGYKLEVVLRMENLDGDNALHLAARHIENSDVVARLLIEADPQLSTALNSKSQQSACFIALAKCNWDVADVLLSSSYPSCSLLGQINGMTALHLVTTGCRKWDLKDDKDLLKFERNLVVLGKVAEAAPDMIKQGDDIGWTPLHYATCYGYKDLVKFFKEKNKLAAYKLDLQDGRSALHIAAFLGEVDTMKALIEACPDCVELVDNRGRNALHVAVLGSQEDAVRFMLSQLPGTLFSEADQDGNTPLQLAVLQKDYNIERVFDKELGYHMQDPQQIKNPYIKKKEKMENKKTSLSSTKLDGGGEDDYGYYQFSATLIATVTFTAAFTIPGGFIQSGGKDEGMAVLTSKPAFQAFIVFDVLAFFASFSIIVLLLYYRQADDDEDRVSKAINDKAVGYYLMISYFGMALAFCCGLYVVLDNTSSFSIVVLLLSLIGTFVAIFGSLFIQFLIGFTLARSNYI